MMSVRRPHTAILLLGQTLFVEVHLPCSQDVNFQYMFSGNVNQMYGTSSCVQSAVREEGLRTESEMLIILYTAILIQLLRGTIVVATYVGTGISGVSAIRYVSFRALTCQVVIDVSYTISRRQVTITFPSCMYCKPPFTPARPLG